MRTGDWTTDTLDVGSDTPDCGADRLDVGSDMLDDASDTPDCGADWLDSGGRLADGPAAVLDRMSDRRNKQAHPLDAVSRPGGRGVDTLDNRRRRLDGAR